MDIVIESNDLYSTVLVTEKDLDAVRFKFNPSGKNNVNEIKALGAGLIACLNKLPESREVSIAKTQVETAVMWAVKAAT